MCTSNRLPETRAVSDAFQILALCVGSNIEFINVRAARNTGAHSFSDVQVPRQKWPSLYLIPPHLITSKLTQYHFTWQNKKNVYVKVLPFGERSVPLVMYSLIEWITQIWVVVTLQFQSSSYFHIYSFRADRIGPQDFQIFIFTLPRGSLSEINSPPDQRGKT